MANTITIKKNAYNSTSAPTSLAFGELAVNNNNGAGAKLYVGSRTSGNGADVTDFQSTILAAVPIQQLHQAIQEQKVKHNLVVIILQ